VTTIDAMRQVKAAVLSIDANKTLIFDEEQFIRGADDAGIVVVGREIA
jgi:DUF1009 family protein